MCTDSSSKKTLTILLLLAAAAVLCFLLGTSGTVSAADPEMEVIHEVRIQNLTYFTVDSTTDLYSYEGMNTTEFRNYYDAASPQDQNEMIVVLEESIYNISRDALKVLFSGSYRFRTNVILDMSTLDTSLPPDAPVTIEASSNANLSKSSYDLPDSSDLEEVVEGTLNMGAVINLDVHLRAPDNGIATYIFYPLTGIIIEEYTSGIHGFNNVTWVMDNTDGFFPELDEKLRMKSDSANPVTEEDIRVELVLDRVTFENTTVSVEMEVRSVEVANFGNLSSSIVSLDFIPADGIRMVIDNGFLNWSWDRIYNESIQPSEAEIETAISESLNVTVDMNFSWVLPSLVGYDVHDMGTEPIMASLESGDINPHLYAISNDSYGIDDINVAKGFLNAGGNAEFEIPAIALDLWVSPSATLIVSPNMRLKNFTGIEQLTVDNRYSYSWDPLGEFEGTIYSTTAEQFTDSRIEIFVEVDVYEIDIEWFSIEDSSVKIDINGDLSFYRMKIPSEIKEVLPDGISIDYIISDVIRLAYDAELIDLDEVNEIIENETREIEEEIQDAFGENAFLSIEIVESSLYGHDVNDMKESPPIMIIGKAHLDIPIAEGLGGGDEEDGNEGDNGNNGGGGNRGGLRITGLQLTEEVLTKEGSSGKTEQMAFVNSVLREFTWDFNLEPIEDWIITYRLILPKGIKVTAISDDLGLVTRGTKDGRDYIQMTITDEENNVTISIGITPMFFINICMLPLALIFLLLLFIIHRRRGKKRKRREMEEELIEARLLLAGGSKPFNQMGSEQDDETAPVKGPDSKKDLKKEKKKLKKLEKEMKRLEKEAEKQKGDVDSKPFSPPASSSDDGFRPPEMKAISSEPSSISKSSQPSSISQPSPPTTSTPSQPASISPPVHPTPGMTQTPLSTEPLPTHMAPENVPLPISPPLPPATLSTHPTPPSTPPLPTPPPAPVQEPMVPPPMTPTPPPDPSLLKDPPVDESK